MTLERLQRLYPRKPAPVVYFLSGTLPAPAILHLRQLGLLLVIALLGPINILWKHGTYVLQHSVQHSWFSAVRDLTLQYPLEDPLPNLTSTTSSKTAWKAKVRSAVTAHWHRKLTAAASNLLSLHFLCPSFLLLFYGFRDNLIHSVLLSVETATMLVAS